MRDRFQKLFLAATVVIFAAWFSPTLTSVVGGTGISVSTTGGVATVSLSAVTNSVTATNTSITVDDTWTDITGMSLPLTAGKYQVTARITADIATNTGVGRMLGRLYNDTDASAISDSEATITFSEVGLENSNTVTIISIITLAGTKTIKGQAFRVAGDYAFSDIASTSGVGFTVLSYVKLSD